MFVLKSHHVVYCDVDNTIVRQATDEDSHSIRIEAPGFEQRCALRMLTIRELTREFEKGNSIVVWSARGYDWAEAVVKALGLEQYVAAVASKPSKYFDDIPCTEFMGSRVYINE